MLTVAEDRLTAAAAVVAAAGGLTVSEDGLTAAAGVVAAAGGLTVSEDGLTVAAGVVAAAGGLTVSADGLTVAAAEAAEGGGLTVSEDGLLAVAGGATAAAAQWSEIMLSSVTAKLFSAVPELVAPLALWPMRFTSWPRCGVRSTPLVVILKI